MADILVSAPKKPYRSISNQVYSIFSAQFSKPAETLYRCVFQKFCRLWFLVDDEQV